MTDFATDTVPERWQEKCEQMLREYAAFAAAYADSGDEMVPTLQEWFEEICFAEQRTAEFTKEDVQAVGHLVGQLLKFEPGSRATARDLLASPWFR